MLTEVTYLVTYLVTKFVQSGLWQLKMVLVDDLMNFKVLFLKVV